MAQATLKGTVEQVALMKALLNFQNGKIKEEDFISAARALGYTPNPNYLQSFITFAYEQAMSVIES